MQRLVLDRRLWLVPVAIWTGVVLSSFVWNWSRFDHQAHELAANRARFVFKVVESMRLWNARHGGVYAVVDEDTPPNPYLNVPEREILTPSGKQLTLINPAYMTRQVAGTVTELSGITVHLTSLKPLNPSNFASEWEAAALRGFERGDKERFELSRANGSALSQYMAPLVTAEPCLKCHAHQGYKVGDIRGGVSVSFDATPILAAVNDQRQAMGLMHLSAWLLLSGLTLFALHRVREGVLSLRQAKAQQDELVERRTAELKEQVREREQTEAWLRLLLESSGEGVFGLDAEGRCTFANPTALELLGYTHSDMLLGRVMEPLLVDGEKRPLAATYRSGEAIHSDGFVFRHADGHRFPVEFRSHPIRISGRVEGAVVTFSDITERKRNEEALRTLSDAVEHSPDSVVITDADGRIEYVNPKFLDTTGYTLKEVTGLKAGFIRSGRTPQATYRDLWRTITAGKVWNGELLNRKKNGDLFWEDAAISPIVDDQGRIAHFVAVKEDVTERKALEQKIWHQANYDALTGLPNRSLFFERLRQAMHEADARNGVVAVLFIDLDRFKEVNDQRGHETGDRLLREAAQRLAACVRETDTVARMGGDEFTVILPELAHKDDAAGVALKIVQRLARAFELDQPVFVSASVGVVIYPDDANNEADLMRKADAAMYQAKEAGRNGYRFYAAGIVKTGERA